MVGSRGARLRPVIYDGLFEKRTGGGWKLDGQGTIKTPGKRARGRRCSRREIVEISPGEKARTVCDSGKWDFDRSDGENGAEERAAQRPAALDREVERATDQSGGKKNKDLLYY